MRKLSFKRKLFGLGAIASLLIAIIAPLAAYKPADAWGQCHPTHVINCGSTSRQEFANQVAANSDGVHNDLKPIFSTIGIFPGDVLGPNTYEGVVKRDNSVWVGNTLVASGVVNGQRGTEGIIGTAASWSGLMWAYPQQNFAPTSSSISAWVYMKDGQFKYAILKPCGNPVVPRLQPHIPSISIEKEVGNVSVDPNAPWVKKNTAKPAETLAYRVKVKNISQVTAENVIAADVLPTGVTLVPGSVKVWCNDQSTPVPDADLTRNGIRLGDMAPGETKWITFRVTVNAAPDSCKLHINKAFARGTYTGNAVESFAETNVICVPVNVTYKINVKKYNDLNGNGTKEDNEVFLSGWKFTTQGSGFAETKTTDENGSITFSGLNGGQYTITEEMQSGWKSTTGVSKSVSVGPDQTVMFGNQQETPPTPPVTPPTPGQPTSLPVSGPVEAAGGVMGTGALGYAGYLWRKSRKTLLGSLKKF